ncbi:tumor susceptibility gene 101 protein [Sitodiplosis mosellana]|uniref:tumor susceptibility gene 101 protein n=1 Tax=Sitodiplosis mosellana TaxID=263140 RepID=UPI002443EF79|nr:tumor susceptibility gene 101 protein [Sitodiplosis mosellana]
MVAYDGQLSKCLAGYQHQNQTKKDVVDVLEQYRGLTFKLENFVFNDGTTKELLNISGTIPVVYKNNTYHIPICIWLMDTHPYNAPLAYVQPTSDMQIKVSMFVDHNGKIYLPYLHEWNPSSSDLLGLIQVMIVTFGDMPPVYAKPKEQVTPYPQQPFMPTPATSGQGYPLPYPASAGAFPPYPTSNFGGFPAYPGASGTANPPSTGYPPYPMPNPSHSGYNSFYGGQSNSSQDGTMTITEEHIKASLISAVEDKLRRRIQERVNQHQAEMDTLNRTKHELNEGRAKINEIISKLEREENELKQNIAILEEKDKALEKSLETLEKVDTIDVDEAVTTTAPLYRQLLNAYAEEAAIEDSIYYIGEALRNGVLDLEVFLKHVRQLSRRQFMLRALMQKCRQKAGLAG